MRSHPCSTGTTAGRKVSGFPTSSVGGRISRQLGSSTNSPVRFAIVFPGHLGCRRIHRFPERLASGRAAWAGLRLQVEHGLDARHACITWRSLDLSPLEPRQHDVWPGLCLFREFCPADLPRRGRLWQRLHDPENAGDDWQKFANLRAYYGFMWTHPGKKLLFMGCEFAQWREWNHDAGLDWFLLDQPEHRGVQAVLRDLNHTYRTEPALHAQDTSAAGFAGLFWTMRSRACSPISGSRKTATGQFSWSATSRPCRVTDTALASRWGCLAGDREHGRRNLWRFQCREFRHSRRRSDTQSRPARLDHPHIAAFGYSHPARGLVPSA